MHFFVRSVNQLMASLVVGACLIQTCGGQTGSLSLSSSSGNSNGMVSLNLSLASTSDNAPSALQWILNYPSPQIAGFSAVQGSAASGAGKSIACSGHTCLLSGMNNQSIQNGVVAVLTFQLAGDASGNLAIQLSNTLGASPVGSTVPLSETDGMISISPVPVIVTLTPLSCELQPSQTQLFIATVSNTSNTAVQWSVSPSLGSVSAAGLYTAPPTMTSIQTVIVTATSVADASKTASAGITLTPPVAVSLSPATVTLYPGQTQQFNATVSNTSNTAVRWSVSPSLGSVSAAGLYTAPPTMTSIQTVTLTATSVADASKTAMATIMLTAGSSTTPVDLSGAYGRSGIVTDGTKFSSGGLDGAGHAYSANLLGSVINYRGSLFDLGAPNVLNVVSSTTVPLPSGRYSGLAMLATSVNGHQRSQTFTVTYTDGTRSFFSQSMSDWNMPMRYSGESIAVSMPYRDVSSGTKQARVVYLYRYSIPLNGSKTVRTITLPNNHNVTVLAITLTPRH